MRAAAIEWSKLVQVIWVSLAAGVGITALFSLVIYGSTRAAECTRDKRSAAATLFGALAVASGIAFFGLVAFAMAIILDK